MWEKISEKLMRDFLTHTVDALAHEKFTALPSPSPITGFKGGIATGGNKGGLWKKVAEGVKAEEKLERNENREEKGRKRGRGIAP